MRRKKKTNPLDYIALPDVELDARAKRSIFIVVLLVFGLVSFLGLLNLSGHFGFFVSKWLTLIFGFGRWLVPFIFLYWAWILIRRQPNSLRFVNNLGLFILFIAYQTLFHFFLLPSSWEAAVRSGSGGGYVGFYLSQAFTYLFGFWGGATVLIALLLISGVLIFNTSLEKMIGAESWLVKLFRPFGIFFKSLFASSPEENGNPSGKEFVEQARAEILEAWQKKEVNPAEEEEEAVLPAITRSELPKVQEKIVWPKRKFKLDLPLALLNEKTGRAISGDTEAAGQKIKNTLEKFGIDVEMGETKVGPTVTQYTFRPAEGVKLSRITTLSNDLSLALAAHPIRIEAPIPGKSLVGVEVPNKAKAIVGLKEILEDNAFKTRKNNLFVALGKDVSGAAWLYDITRMPHLLVAGATNSGKSVCLNAMIVSLLYQNNPEDLRFIMVDPKRVELPAYNGIPHLLTPVITEVSKTINALKWCLNEMDRRYDLLNQAGKKNIASYNAVASEKMPFIIFIIDELADFMMTAGKEMEAAVIRLAQMSRAIGIHLILATQRPSVDVITGLIKANIPTRIAFSVASLVDSKTILDMSGAEKLLGQGDMLFMTAELSKPKRIQGAYLSDTEINDVVNFIKDKSGPAEYLEGITDRQKVGGVAGVGLDGNHGDEDELFQAAQEIIIKANKASTSMLQRRLSIGYGRAAKILDMLEEARVIGPANGSKPREVLISQAQYDAQVGLSGVPLHDRATAVAPDSYLGDDEEGDDGVLAFKDEFGGLSKELEDEDYGTSQREKNSLVENEGEEKSEEQEDQADLDKVANELAISPTEEDDIIEDEDEILEEIKESQPLKKSPHIAKSPTTFGKGTAPVKSTSTPRPNPLDDDDEMFFAR